MKAASYGMFVVIGLGAVAFKMILERASTIATVMTVASSEKGGSDAGSR